MMRYQGLLNFTFLLFVTANLWAKPIVICESCEVKSISEGIKLAVDFDTLLVKKGTYKEFNIIIDKPLTLIGEDYPIIDGEKKGEIIRMV